MRRTRWHLRQRRSPLSQTRVTPGQILRGGVQLERFDIDADGVWGRVMHVAVPVNPAVFNGQRTARQCVASLLTPSGQVIGEIGPSRAR
jgi:hypothetical protein